ncbi:CHASE domain-containing protein [Roseateles oligotrophus]|uniref:histidine kinase n=1 Tax=Roseateles oligotrophus TaxID=1769250 RepID=A0ABT2YMH1_9BURK|nr:CHASE domain-containing protein [Roseateles oligotrophus]MCV2371080.1 CHASE domain-containing protein [Roseateles oligotrophus]
MAYRHWYLAGSGKALTLVTLLLGLGLSAAAARWQWQSIQADAEAEFQRNVERTAKEVEQRFAHPVHGLAGARGLYAASRETRQRVKRADFRAYVESRDLAKEFPGVRGFGFIEQVMRGERDRFVADERADGAPGFAIRQLADKDHPDYYVIKLIDPAANNAGAQGLDVGSEAQRRAGAMLAASSGLATISGAITLVQDQRKTPGVLMFLPVYRRGVPLDNAEQRNAGLLGLLYSPIVIRELLGKIPDVMSGRVDFELYDARAGASLGTPMFDADGHVTKLSAGQPDSQGRRFSHQREITVVNRALTLRMNSTPQFDATIDGSTPWLLFAAGAMISAMLALMLRQQAAGRERAEGLVEARTAELMAAQRDNETLLSTLNLAAIVSVADRAGRITMANDSFCQVSGYSRAELLGQTHRIINSGQHPAEFWDEMWAQISAGFAWRGEVCNRAKDGSFYWVDSFVAPVLGADEQIEKYIAICTDITASKKAGEALRWNQSLLEMMSNSSPLAFFVVDNRSDQILYFNQRFCDIWGMNHQADAIRRGELKNIDTMPTRRALVADEAAFTARYQSLQDESNRAQVEDEIVFKDGRTIRRFSTQIRDADDHYFGRFFIFEDVTERKQALLALQQATAAAEAASVAKSQFLANMSHEIRTPMNAVLGMLTLLRKTEMTPRQADYAAKSDGAARSLLGLLNEILDFSKIEAGKMELDPQPFGIDQLMRDLSVIFAANVESKPVEVLFDIDPQLPRRLVGDAMRLQQILINLGGNAIKFTERGEVLLGVKLVQRGASTVTLQFSVQDSGIGIALENQQRIFSGFTQAESSTTRRFGGTGLGVAISQRFVTLMGGQLLLDSELGRGSRFSFTIELPLAEETGALAAAAPVAVSAAPDPAWRTLVVDDNALARDLLERMAESLGWQVDLAESGEQALSLMQAQAAAGTPYRAVFLDWQMPGLDGWQTSQRIQELGLKGEATLLLMVTAHGRDMLSRRSQAEQDSLDGFLVKPLTASMLFDAVVDAGRGRQLAHPSQVAALAGQQRLASMRLLLVEDNLNNQQVALELLSDEGALVQIANHGQEAVDMLVAAGGEMPFDVVLMDLQMPVMDGLSASRYIREQLGLRRLPIVAMTANAMSSDREACLAAGMNDHVGKPFALDQLVAVLRKQAGLNAGEQTATQTPPAAVNEVDAAASAAGVELELALRRLGGKRASYARLLGRFASELAVLPTQLREQLAQADFESAARLQHTLKGTAATLGATALADAAGAAEKLIGTWRQQAPAAAELAQVCEASCAAMAAALPGLRALHEAFELSFKAERDGTVVAPSPKRAALQALEQQLLNSDMAALDSLLALGHRFGADLGPQLSQLEEAIGDLDFRRALLTCRALLAAA